MEEAVKAFYNNGTIAAKQTSTPFDDLKELIQNDNNVSEECKKNLLQKIEAFTSNFQSECDKLQPRKSKTEQEIQEETLRNFKNELTSEKEYEDKWLSLQYNIKEKLEFARKHSVPTEDVLWLMKHNPMFLNEVRSNDESKTNAFRELNEKINEISAPYGIEVRRRLQYLCTQNSPLMFIQNIKKLNCFKKSYFPSKKDYNYSFEFEINPTDPTLVTIKVIATTKEASKLEYNKPEKENSKKESGILESKSKKFDGSFTLSYTAKLSENETGDSPFNSLEGTWKLTPPKSSRWWPFR